MVSMKYYIVTIAALFVALGTGILIGVNLNESDFYLRQQQLLLEGIETKFNELQVERESYMTEIDGLIREKEKNSAFIDNLYKEIIKQRLVGYNIAIIKTTDIFYYDDVPILLEEAGANIAIEITYKDRIFNYSEEEKLELYEIFNIYDYNELIAAINDQVVNFLTFGKESEFLTYLIENQWIGYTGNKAILEDSPIHYVVIAGGSLSKEAKTVEEIDLDIINKCKKNVIPVVGIERIDAGYSYIPYYKKEKISTVDNINTIMGKVSLVYIITGINGHFGEGEYSENLIPSLIEY
ncbi:copper transporter [Alkaliphilus peptidifermentans]|uniref:Copper transport outer membrane protein, MctB n=1 Tax=Alkaliphilus peptidifermentans DSM 18978 TaxID=1120976 RepID=A0A1G5KFR5_9FIRM|nr:copper transporter [Alkaliphilus peptidifermentans]SCY98900.1 Copper transport outer membrane protein, MctB [Alkaliphilus peptidifermentans DSM 18978]